MNIIADLFKHSSNIYSVQRWKPVSLHRWSSGISIS